MGAANEHNGRIEIGRVQSVGFNALSGRHEQAGRDQRCDVCHMSG